MRGPASRLLLGIAALLAVVLALRWSTDPGARAPSASRPAASAPEGSALPAEGVRLAQDPAAPPVSADPPAVAIVGPATRAPVAADPAAPAAHDRASPPRVRGRVVDAGSGRPIPGAWVTWRPPPPWLVDEVLGSPSLVAAGEGLISDAEGRFELERLPPDERPGAWLHAVAPGWAPGRAGWLRRRGEVVIELAPAGALEVLLRAPVPPEAGLALVGPQGERIEAPPRTGPDDLRAWRLHRLPPGTWQVTLWGKPAGEALVAAGQRAVLEVTPPARLALRGRVEGLEPAERAEARVRFSRDRGELALEAPLDPQAGFACELPPGGWRVELRGPAGELPLVAAPGAPPGELELRPEATTLSLSLPARTPVELRLPVGPWADPGDEVALVAVDEPESVSVLVLEAADASTLRARGQAPPGAHAVLLGGVLAGRVQLPAAGPLTVIPRPCTVRVHLEGPAWLPPGQPLRGLAKLLPAGIPMGVQSRLTEGEKELVSGGTTEWQLLCPGSYTLVVSSELGPTLLRREVAGDEEWTVQLGGR